MCSPRAIGLAASIVADSSCVPTSASHRSTPGAAGADANVRAASDVDDGEPQAVTIVHRRASVVARTSFLADTAGWTPAANCVFDMLLER